MLAPSIAEVTLDATIASWNGLRRFRVEGFSVDGSFAAILGGDVSTLAEGIRVRVTGSVRGKVVTARSIEIRSLLVSASLAPTSTPSAAPTAGSAPTGTPTNADTNPGGGTTGTGTVGTSQQGSSTGGASPVTPAPVASASPRGSPYVEDTVQVTGVITKRETLAEIKVRDASNRRFTIDARDADVRNGRKRDLEPGRSILLTGVRGNVIKASTIDVLK